MNVKAYSFQALLGRDDRLVVLSQGGTVELTVTPRQQRSQALRFGKAVGLCNSTRRMTHTPCFCWLVGWFLS